MSASRTSELDTVCIQLRNRFSVGQVPRRGRLPPATWVVKTLDSGLRIRIVWSLVKEASSLKKPRVLCGAVCLSPKRNQS